MLFCLLICFIEGLISADNEDFEYEEELESGGLSAMIVEVPHTEALVSKRVLNDDSSNENQNAKRAKLVCATIIQRRDDVQRCFCLIDIVVRWFGRYRRTIQA